MNITRETGLEAERRLEVVRAKRNIARGVGIALMIAAPLFLAALARYQLRLIVFGTRAVGQIVAYEPTPKGWGKPVVRVTLANGETIEFLGTSIKDDWLEVGDTVPVYYLAYEPTFGETATFRRFWMGVIVITGMIVISLGGGLWLLRYARNL